MGSHSANSDGPEPDPKASLPAEDETTPEVVVEPGPVLYEAQPRDDLPPLETLGGRPIPPTRQAPGTYQVHPPAGKKAKKRKHRGVGAIVISGSVLVVAGAMVALWIVGPNSATKSIFTDAQAASVFLAQEDFPKGWEVGVEETTTTTPSELATNEYWAAESVTDPECAVVDKSFGLLVYGQPPTAPAASSDVIVNGNTAYSAQGQLVQQSARVFSDAQSAGQFTAVLSAALTQCSSYTAETSSGRITQKISPQTVSGLTSAGVAFAVTSESGNVNVAFVRRSNLIIQVIAGEPASGDTSAISWRDVVSTIDARLSALKN